MRGHKVTEEDREEICRRYLKGDSYRVIGNSIGLSQSAVYRVVKSNNLIGKRYELEQACLKAETRTEEMTLETDRIKDYLLQGYSVNRAAKLTGKTRRLVVYCYLELVRDGNDMEKAVSNGIAREHNNGLKPIEIRRKLDVTAEEFRRAYLENGFSY